MDRGGREWTAACQDGDRQDAGEGGGPEFCKGICDQRPEGARGRLHQERAEEGWGGQLRRSVRVATAPQPRAICLLRQGGDCRLTSPAHQGGEAMRGTSATSVSNPPLPSPPFCFKEVILVPGSCIPSDPRSLSVTGPGPGIYPCRHRGLPGLSYPGLELLRPGQVPPQLDLAVSC
ncbi:coactosin-like 1 (Dictyostelium), isoform CRA_a [Mus musculus]|nr:coactosin-like 1 (Dictyostelium), isoform CRA_a [Mus musculus]